MSEEEIQQALEIIKQPITVNCIEYKYFDQDNYDNLIRVYENCLWFIRNFEQINITVEQLQQENQQLKDRINKTIEYLENDLQSFLYSIEYKNLLEILKGE